MTTPRVTVPVEPTPLSVCRAIAPYLGAIEQNDWSGLDDDDAISMPVKMRVGDLRDLKAVISAAPAPEGGAADALGEALIQADLKIRSLPGTDQSDVEFIREALATREEAPAEAGERTDIARAIRRAVGDAWIGEHQAEVAADAVLALRAQPPAREDAQPVGIVDGLIGRLNTAELDDGTPLYTHPAPDALRAAVSDIAAERQRQIDAEGWSAERDDEYTDRSLAHAAAAYALGLDLETRPEVITDDVSGGRGDTPVWRNREIRVPASWPTSWAAEWWKPSDARRDLVKAGALIVAEIERLDRAALQAEQKGGAA